MCLPDIDVAYICIVCGKVQKRVEMMGHYNHNLHASIHQPVAQHQMHFVLTKQHSMFAINSCKLCKAAGTDLPSNAKP